MVYKFIAYEVDEGDAFLVEHDGFVFLVDGGKSRTQLPGYLKKDNIRRIDKVICTHVDADHRCGIEALLDDYSFNIGELWVPYIVVKSLKIATEDPEAINRFSETFGPELEKYRADNLLTCACCYDLCRGPIKRAKGYGRSKRETVESGILKDLVIKYADIVAEVIPEKIAAKEITGPSLKLANRITDNTKSWASILKRAHERDIKVIYWDYVAKWLRNNSAPLSCQNARKIRAEEKVGLYTKGREMFVFALTIQNEQSLVFRYEPYRNSSHILFTADSGLGFLEDDEIDMPPYSIITVPHHGSQDEENTRAYDRINATDPSFWVRTRNNQVGDSLNANFYSKRNRYCTVCKLAGITQRLVLECSGSGFQPTSGVLCCCP